MNKKSLTDAQEYLTFITPKQVQKIVDVGMLLNSHPKESVIDLLRDISKDREKQLMQLIQEDKTSSDINDAVATMFRVHMAIKAIQNGGAP